jgi:hypothetical protein
MAHSLNQQVTYPLDMNCFAGCKYENIYLYYKLISVAILGNARGLKLVMNIPLRTVNRYFTLYKAIPLPTRTVKNNFVQFKLEHGYFGWNHVQHNFFQYTEADKKQCSRGSKLAICPANTTKERDGSRVWRLTRGAPEQVRIGNSLQQTRN